MRTTLTIDPDVARQLEQERRRTQRSLKQIINDALRVGLSHSPPSRQVSRYRVKARRSGFRAGVDPERLNQLLDQLDAEHAALKATAQQLPDPPREQDNDDRS